MYSVLPLVRGLAVKGFVFLALTHHLKPNNLTDITSELSLPVEDSIKDSAAFSQIQPSSLPEHTMCEPSNRGLLGHTFQSSYALQLYKICNSHTTDSIRFPEKGKIKVISAH